MVINKLKIICENGKTKVYINGESEHLRYIEEVEFLHNAGETPVLRLGIECHILHTEDD